MIECNHLFQVAHYRIAKLFQELKVKYYPADIGTAYKDLFHRSALACYSFYVKNGNQYYMYFNSAYDSTINRMVFSSITIVSRDNLNKKIAKFDSKTHIADIKDLTEFLSELRKDVV